MAVSGVEVIIQGQASASAEIVATTSADAAIVGQKGDQGPAGPAGPVGPSGPTGQDGPVGPYHTFVITVANPGYGNRYYIDSNLTPVITGVRGFRYIFDQSDSSNLSHDFALSLTDGGSHEGGTQYTSGWTSYGAAGVDGSGVFEIPFNAPDTMYYYCKNHNRK